MTTLTNYVQNPGAEGSTLSLEQDSAVTVARTNTAEGTMPTRGSYFYTLTATGTAEARARLLLTQRAACTVGQRWWARVKVRAKASNAAPRTVSVALRFYDAVPGATAGTTLQTTWSAGLSLAAGADGDIWVTGVAPASTASVGLLVRREATGAIGDVIQVDQVNLIRSTDAVTPPPLIAGDMGNAYAWASTENASVSTLYTPSPTLEAHATFDPYPRVRVDVVDLYPATRSVTLFRVVDDELNSVRDTLNLAAIGAFTALDTAPPFGVPITYRAMQYDAAGNELGFTSDTSTTTVTPLMGDGSASWGVISDPLKPDTFAIVEFTENAAQRPTRPIPSTTHRMTTADGGVRVVALVGPEGLLEDLPMDFWTATPDEFATIRQLINQARGLVLIRTLAPMPVPRSLYCFARLVPDTVDTVTVGDVEWAATVQELTPTTLGYVSALFPWSLYKAAFPTWADMKAAYSTWLSAKKNPPAVGP